MLRCLSEMKGVETRHAAVQRQSKAMRCDDLACLLPSH